MKIFPEDVHQQIRLRRTLLAGGAALILSLLVWIAGEYNMVRLQKFEILTRLIIFWAVNIFFLYMLRSGINLRFRDPSLTVPQILWATTCILYIIYFIHDVRAAFLMICLLVINFGAFRMNLLQLAGLSVYATAVYAFVIYLLYVNHPEIFGLQLELFVLTGFAAALLGTTVVGQEMFVLRSTLRDRNEQLGNALEKVNLMAVTDDLTGLHNRRFIDDVLVRQVALAHRGNYQFSICFFDLDHFKNINDTYGHAAGDEVLKEVARIAMSATRAGDYVARYGGEEFILVLSATDAESAVAVAERVREMTEKTNFDSLGADLRVTISCGVTPYRAPETVDDILERADKAMYMAKNGGRNAVVCS